MSLVTLEGAFEVQVWVIDTSGNASSIGHASVHLSLVDAFVEAFNRGFAYRDVYS